MLDLLREKKSFLVSSTGFISKDMKEGLTVNCDQKKGQDMRHIPQSAFWELLLGVTAWIAQQWEKKKKSKKDILGIWAFLYKKRYHGRKQISVSWLLESIHTVHLQ